MNFNHYQPNSNDIRISAPFIENVNNHISLSDRAINYYSNRQNISFHNNHNQKFQDTNNLPIPLNYQQKSNSEDNLKIINPIIKIEDRLNHQNSENDLNLNVISTNDPEIQKTPTLEENFINSDDIINFSLAVKDFMRNNKKSQQDENLFSNENQNKNIKAAINGKTNEEQQNCDLIFLSEMKRQLENMRNQNTLLKNKLKKQIEHQARVQAVENLLIENKTLNALLSSKIFENIEFQKIIASLPLITKSSKILILNKLEKKNEELRIESNQNSIGYSDKTQICKKNQEKYKISLELKEGLKIKEMTYHIELLNINGEERKTYELIKELYIKVEELFNLIKFEFKIK